MGSRVFSPTVGLHLGKADRDRTVGKDRAQELGGDLKRVPMQVHPAQCARLRGGTNRAPSR